MDTDLSGKCVLVTGGAGGIGSAVVRAFAAEGARVAIHYRTSEEAAVRLADEVGGIALAADLTVEAEVDALVPPETIRPWSWWPMPGLAVRGSAGLAAAPERGEATLRSNLTATFLTARPFRHAAPTGSGSLDDRIHGRRLRRGAYPIRRAKDPVRLLPAAKNRQPGSNGSG
jgi:3-oxoacyl-[acyl-carrier protein] reductase